MQIYFIINDYYYSTLIIYQLPIPHECKQQNSRTPLYAQFLEHEWT